MYIKSHSSVIKTHNVISIVTIGCNSLCPYNEIYSKLLLYLRYILPNHTPSILHTKKKRVPLVMLITTIIVVLVGNYYTSYVYIIKTNLFTFGFQRTNNFNIKRRSQRCVLIRSLLYTRFSHSSQWYLWCPVL